ncbi:hypothetical protein TGPRC2_269620 [Toxoplasma gondii TgCatPRC2]|uniref:Uncharacterized protein n=2 Tax=Toxoplasma gondii TaxID=5811 RepID=A0A151HNP1_TOXGO|nr:hypothetical protein TGARI_269620 [Toxoplasma gondii ARI]KYK70942.1 hypothetical protein TGPRC2_269620 [Toxoplasma gondii TgCatPRC2]
MSACSDSSCENFSCESRSREDWQNSPSDGARAQNVLPRPAAARDTLLAAAPVDVQRLRELNLEDRSETAEGGEREQPQPEAERKCALEDGARSVRESNRFPRNAAEERSAGMYEQRQDARVPPNETVSKMCGGPELMSRMPVALPTTRRSRPVLVRNRVRCNTDGFIILPQHRRDDAGGTSYLIPPASVVPRPSEPPSQPPQFNLVPSILGAVGDDEGDLALPHQQTAQSPSSLFSPYAAVSSLYPEMWKPRTSAPEEAVFSSGSCDAAKSSSRGASPVSKVDTGFNDDRTRPESTCGSDVDAFKKSSHGSISACVSTLPAQSDEDNLEKAAVSLLERVSLCGTLLSGAQDDGMEQRRHIVPDATDTRAVSASMGIECPQGSGLPPSGAHAAVSAHPGGEYAANGCVGVGHESASGTAATVAEARGRLSFESGADVLEKPSVSGIPATAVNEPRACRETDGAPQAHAFEGGLTTVNGVIRTEDPKRRGSIDTSDSDCTATAPTERARDFTVSPLLTFALENLRRQSENRDSFDVPGHGLPPSLDLPERMHSPRD